MTTQTISTAVRATPAEVWQALTDGAVTPAYYYGFRAEYGDLAAGTPYRYTAGGGDVITGTVLEVEPGARLKATFAGHWDPAVDALGESTVTFTVSEPFAMLAGVTMLSCVHEGLPAGPAADSLEVGWVAILSGLKTLLETGAPMAPAA